MQYKLPDVFNFGIHRWCVAPILREDQIEFDRLSNLFPLIINVQNDFIQRVIGLIYFIILQSPCKTTK